MKAAARRVRDDRLANARAWLLDLSRDAKNGVPISESKERPSANICLVLLPPNDAVIKMIVDWMDEENIDYECAHFNRSRPTDSLSREHRLP